ncbi:DEAD/DEAH box helicase [Geomonas nitrogeniifigens]|uniref:DEAD/DEAH box helicase n=1 Tax=Geomonas diazotrophica TaxID=2843197 RepID=A0ABX8JH53_9BACT|nr:DEAD/DEAH box helicase [Geomonas nitrogeniifigens]QWV96012.1 DEAD/DEAH box helicase [Geomonas nitrogeniifigens]
MPSALRHFHPLIQKWFIEKVGKPTDVQLRAWTEISQERHVLVTAPTGSGKTLAAFLWAINQLVTGAWSCGETRVLYVSPLKALNNDVRRNLIAPLAQLRDFFAAHGEEFPAIAVQTRSGDTPGDERRRMLRHPPEILITTPESLNILVTSKGSRSTLTGVVTVILDEIHAVAGDKRGTHLITAVERLTLLSGEFQRIALSATVRPLETVADFVAGLRQVGQRYQQRPVALVRGEQEKRFELEISAPEAMPPGAEGEFWPALVDRFTEIITRHRSTLFFANSRRTTERVTRLINELSGEELAYSHHGSLSREIRLAVEERLKRGELKAIVATNSLELGIDIGKLESVVLIQTPRSISSAIQRIGRSGHGVGEVSSGMLFPTYGMDFVCAAVIARAIADGEIEELHPVEAPLDLLAQIILAMGLPEQWHLDELYDFLRCSYPYRNLSRRQFDLVIGMLEGKYADSHVPELRPRVTVDRLEETVATRPALSMLVYLEGGTIPERGYFELRLKETGAKIGELDEEFVWERRLGDTFALGAQVWQITEISHSTVLVVPARKPQQIIPFWRAEELDRDFYYSEKIAAFLESCEERLGHPSDMSQQGLVEELMQRHFMDRGAAQALETYLKLQREASRGALPHRHHLLVEHFRDPVGGADTEQIILHTLWGNAVNRPFTFALTAAWERRYGYPLQAFYNNDGIALLLPHETDRLNEILELVTPDNIEPLLRESLEGTGYFGARFRENAGRALLLSRSNFKRRMPLWLNRLRSKKLLASVLRYRDFPVLMETWRSALKDDFDLANLRRLLEEIQDGTIAVTRVDTREASPFAKGLIWQQTNKYVYEDDTLGGGRKSALGSDFLKELALSPHLRPDLPLELVHQFQEKRQRLAPGYAPDSARELIDWVKERLLVPLYEWPELLQALARDGGPEAEELLPQVAERLVLLESPGADGPLVAALEMIPEIAEGLGRSREEIVLSVLPDHQRLPGLLQESLDRLWQRKSDAGDAAEEEEPAAARLVGRWLGYYGPVEVAVLQRTLGLEENLLRDALQTLEETGAVLVDQFTEGAAEPQVCDAVNLEALLRMLRRSRRPAFEALPLAQLPLFLAQFQGVAEPGRTPEELRDRLEQLLGAPLPASLWEEEVLPARLAPYLGTWLDSLMQTSDLLWFGCGPKRLTFAFPEDLDLFQDQEESGTGVDVREHASLIPDHRGHYNLSAICSIAGVTAATATTELWQEAWRGDVSNDSFVAVRKGILNRFELPQGDSGHLRHPAHGRPQRRLPGSRWSRVQEGPGNWFLLPQPQGETDVLEKEERNKDRVRVLLERYGILFRELLTRELPSLQWSRLFRTLRIMEMSGELVCGNFFTGIPGLQFVTQETYRLLERGLSQDAIFWLNAADPASLCGSGLEGLREELPSRIPSTHLVYHGPHLVLISRRYGKELEFRAEAEHPQLESYLALFRALVGRDFNPLKRVTVERINGEPAKESPYAEALRRFGFQESYSGLEYWRQYP